MSTFERSLDAEQGSRPIYKVYKRRFWGLAQLVLLNIVVSWDVCASFRLIYILDFACALTLVYSG